MLIKMTETHIYIMKLRKRLKPILKKKLNLVEKIYVQFDKTSMIPEMIELHYRDKDY